MSSKDIRVTIIQSTIHWENMQTNLDMFSQKINSVKKSSTDLIVLPEMFTTGFSMNTEKLAVDKNHPVMEWMYTMAELKKCAICGSIMMKDKEQIFNRFVFMTEKGKASFYDKKHLFRMGNENEHYTEGTKRITIEYKGWKIRPMICYDLRFPVWSYNQVTNIKNELEYDVLLYVANWPEKRSEAWSQLLLARAIENQSYVVGVNRIGIDGNKIPHSGNSVVIDPLGKVVSKTKANKESIETIVLSHKLLQTWRKQFPVFADADRFKMLK